MGKYGENLANAVAAQLRAERSAAELTQKQLAEKAGLDAQSVMRYEKGEREPTAGKLGALCDALGVTPQELMMRAVDRIK